MSIGISDNYVRLEPEDVPARAAELADGWKSPEIPMRQWISVVRGEVQRFREGVPMPHFEILIRALKSTGLENPTLLDVGASSGFYSEILKIGGFDCQYHGLDYSPAYKELAESLFPGIAFTVGDARDLPFDDGAFDVVLSGCCLLHVFEADRVIAETARVAKQYAVFNRTPVLSGDFPTVYWEKKAYGVSCIECHMNEAELLGMFAVHRLEVVSHEDVFWGADNNFGHRTYLLKKLT